MKSFFILTIILLPAGLMAQTAERQVIGTAGAYAEAGGVSHSYTAGEVVTATFSGGTIVLTQGFQQADPVSVSIAEEALQFDAIVFPNPTMDGVTLTLNAGETVSLQIDLFDASGKHFPVSQRDLVFSGTMQRQIDFNGFASGTYFIRLSDVSGKLHQTIRVQKVN